MNWKTILAKALGKTPDEIKAEYAGLSRVTATRHSRHAAGHTKPRGWRKERKAQRKAAEQSRRRNREK
jgi:hypothetical protein